MGSYQATCTLRWVDLDAQGHVNNSVFVDYLQEARTEFFNGGPTAAMLADGVVVVGHKIEYLRPISFDTKPLTIELSIPSLGAARIVIAYRVLQNDVECARARTLLCPFDFPTQRPRRIYPDERAYFASVQVDSEPFSELKAPSLQGRGHHFEVFTRWSDQDAYGHVNNVRYFDYIQEARIAMTTQVDPSMARVGMQAGTASPDRLWLVARQDVDYVQQMSDRDEPYRAVTAVSRVGDSSLTLACEIIDPLRDGAVFAKSRTVLVSADAAGKPLSIADAQRAALDQFRLAD